MSYKCATLSAVNGCKPYMLNYWVTLNLWRRKLNHSQKKIPGTESLSYTTLLCLQHLVQPRSVSSSCRIRGLQHPYERDTISAADACRLYLQSQARILQLEVINLKCSLCLLGVSSESLAYTTFIGVPL